MPAYFDQAWVTLTGMGRTFVARLPLIIVAVIVFLAIFFAARGVRALVRRLASEKRRHRNLGLALGRIAQGAMIVLGALTALTIIFPSFKAADLIGLLGLGGVAIGFAFRDILGNFLAGILLLLTEPFKIGDQIIVGAFEGTVTDIQTRATFIRTYDGRRIVIPNEKLFTESVTVNTARENRRSQFDVGIGLGDDIGRAKQLMLDAIRRIDGVLADPPPEALVLELGDFAVKVRLMWWTTPPAQINMLRTTDQVLTAVKQTLIANGIDLPYPTHQVLFHDQTEESDGDRARQREGWPAGKGGDIPKPSRIGDALRLIAPRRPRAAREDDDDGEGDGGGAGDGRRRDAEPDADANDPHRRARPTAPAPAPRADAR